MNNYWGLSQCCSPWRHSVYVHWFGTWLIRPFWGIAPLGMLGIVNTWRGREVCSGAKQVFSHFQMESRNIKWFGKYLLVMASFSSVMSPAELVTGMLLNPADETMKFTISSVWRETKILLPPPIFFPNEDFFQEVRSNSVILAWEQFMRGRKGWL